MLRSTLPRKDGVPVLDVVRLPFFESIPVGSGVGPGLVAGYRYIYYTTPQDEPIELYGFSANFQNVNVRITLADMRLASTWTPFFTTQMTAIFGAVGQAEPVLMLPRPYTLPPKSRIQIGILNNDASNISATVLTIVGSRLRKVV